MAVSAKRNREKARIREADPENENPFHKEIILTEEQNAAKQGVLKWFKNGLSDEYRLTGYAGTGKTTLLADIISYLMFTANAPRIAITAPTNKAVRVIKDSLSKKVANLDSHLKTDACTIHSLLGLVVYNDDEHGVAKVKKNGPGRVKSFDLVIVDEASMIDKQVYQHIIESQNGQVKYLFVGDPAQLPPINEKESLAISNPDVFLKNIMRQAAENPIISLATEIRENITEPKDFFSKWERKEPKEFLSHAIDFFKTNANSDGKILCYTNKAVNMYNDFVRKKIYGENAADYEKGEVIFVNEVTNETASNGVIRSDELIVIEVEKVPEEITALNQKFNFYSYEIYVKNPYTEWEGYINPVTVEHRPAYDKLIEMLFQNAAKMPPGSDARKAGYKLAFEVKERYDVVSYNFALTIHKSQGSTYKEVWLDSQDAMINNKTRERNQLFYVACTRPSDKLHVK